MEQKQIVAVVLIVIVIGAIAVVGFMFLPAAPYGALVTGQLVTPGAPAGTPSDQIIKVGLIGDTIGITGEHNWKGAYMACDEINTAGGIEINGTTYYFGLVAEDTSEEEPQLDTTKGTAAVTKLITQDGAQFIMGGFRSEALLSYLELVMDEEMLFLDTGAATDIFCQKVAGGPWPQISGPDVVSDYDRYKYFFRVMPINSTSLITSLFTYCVYLKGFLNATQGLNVTRVALLREDLEWTAAMPIVMTLKLPSIGMEMVADVAFPPDAEAADFTTYWNQIQTADAQITIPVLSGPLGILMTTQYAAVQPNCFLVGINVQGQLDNYWNKSGGACQYETILQSVHKTAKSPKTIPFWDDFIELYGGEPLYTAVGAYDGLHILAQAIEDAQSLVSANIVPYLEAINTDSPYTGVGGVTAFTYTHDLFASQSFGYTLLCQWQAGGTKVVVPTGGYIYPATIETGSLTLPPWGINA
ncbi:MAG: ABC transporter substrate-binding protein [Promethearchaeota archaeon]